ncbi:S41 family peptidase [Cohnella panacarvi]|uniref:S41 family peptidase n=1 Tax=Cohnella panacarvi TaxID=400776 RepID=UPI00047A4F01|nr:S41 family peptidase [Cohnella panacarvi]
MTKLRGWKSPIAVLLGLTLLLGLTSVATAADTPEQIKEVRELLLNYHYGNPSERSLAINDIDQMIATLDDPYTEFYDEKEWKAFNSVLEKTFVGIGIVMREDKGSVYVDEVLEGSPAEAVGIAAGDLLTATGGKSLQGKTTAEIQQLLLGEEGTKVSLTVTRGGKKLSFIIVRKQIHLNAVTSSMLGDGIGYLALSGFTSDAATEVKKQLAELEKNGMKSLVFDLRDNGGGYVDTAQKIAGLFLENGVLAYMRDRDNNDEALAVTGTRKSYPLVVLVNGNSASASELLAGALQDYRAASLVGMRTYGKGVVQSIVALKSGGVLKLTIRQYLTPKEHKVDKVGLTPDVVVEDPASQLVKAYRMVGGHKVTITAKNDIVTMGDVRMAEPSAAFKNDKGVWYVNIRMGASVAGADLAYDADRHVFKLTKGTEARTLPSDDSHLVVKNGRTLVEVDFLKQWYPGLKYSVKDETLKLSSAG